MVNKKFKKIFMILTLCLTLILGSSINAYAYVDESVGTEATTEAVEVEEELTVETEEESTEETLMFWYAVVRVRVRPVSMQSPTLCRQTLLLLSLTQRARY